MPIIERTRSKDSEFSTSFPPFFGVKGSGQFSGRNANEAQTSALSYLERLKPSLVYPASEHLVRMLMHDYVNTDFKKIREANEFRPILPMSQKIVPSPVARIRGQLKYVTQASKPSGSVSFSCNVGASTFEIVDTIPLPRFVVSEEDKHACSVKAMASLKSAGMDYLTSLAELRETIAMFRNLKGNLLSTFDKTIAAWDRDLSQKRRRGKFKGFYTLKQAWESFSNFWLEYRFGWRILYYDFKSIVDYMNRDPGRRLYTRRAKAEGSETSRELIHQVGNGYSGTYEIWRVAEFSETYRAGYSAFIDDDSLGNPILLNTAYDLTAWTLVVDMFFNIQDNIIASSQFPINASLVEDSGFFSSRKDVSVAYAKVFVPPTKPYAISEAVIDISGAALASSSYDRGKLADPDFSVSFQPDLNLGKLVDLATLAIPLMRVFRKFKK